MGRSRFQNHWMDRPEFVRLRRDSTDVFRAYCRVCQRSFDVKNMGEGAVKSHGAGAKHVTNMTRSKQLTRTTNSVSTFFTQPTIEHGASLIDQIITMHLLTVSFIISNYVYSSDNQISCIVMTLQQCLAWSWIFF